MSAVPGGAPGGAIVGGICGAIGEVIIGVVLGGAIGGAICGTIGGAIGGAIITEEGNVFSRPLLLSPCTICIKVVGSTICSTAFWSGCCCRWNGGSTAKRGGCT